MNGCSPADLKAFINRLDSSNIQWHVMLLQESLCPCIIKSEVLQFPIVILSLEGSKVLFVSAYLPHGDHPLEDVSGVLTDLQQ
eukprot:4134292-Heterocapsa_arctica.AAC.1